MNRVCRMFSQIFQLVPRERFAAAVQKHQAERHARGFSSWGQLVAMLFCQLGQAKSLREISEGLQASEGKLKHCPWQLFETVFQMVLEECRPLPRFSQTPLP